MISKFIKWPYPQRMGLPKPLKEGPYTLIILIGFAVYFQSLFFGFSYLDDNKLILENYHFIRNLANIPQIFKEDVFRTAFGGFYYRPLLVLSFMLDAQIGKVSPFIYHFSNIIFHLIASCLVFLFFMKLRYEKNVSLFFSIIFTVHPVLTQAVAWIPGRNDTLLAIFVLASFILFLDFLETRKWPYLWGHLLFFGLSLLIKETAVVLPFACILFILLISKDRLISLVTLSSLSGWVFICLSWFFVRLATLKAIITGNSNYDIIKSLISNSPAAFSYLGKIIFPFNLSVLPILKNLPLVYGVVTLVLVVSFLFFSKRKSLAFIVFGISWFMLFLLPSFIRPISSTADFAEHRIYLALIGLMIVFLEIDFIKNINFTKKKVLISAIAVILFFSTVTVLHSNSFRNRINFWKNAVKASPDSAFNHNNLGAMYYLDGLVYMAELEWQKALELNPNERLVHNNLGLLYMGRGQLQEAEAEYIAELQINPTYDTAYFNLGLLYYRGGKPEEAEQLWKRALEINPDYVDTYYNLIAYYQQVNDTTQLAYYLEQLKKRGISLPPSLKRF